MNPGTLEVTSDEIFFRLPDVTSEVGRMSANLPSPSSQQLHNPPLPRPENASASLGLTEFNQEMEGMIQELLNESISQNSTISSTFTDLVRNAPITGVSSFRLNAANPVRTSPAFRPVTTTAVTNGTTVSHLDIQLSREDLERYWREDEIRQSQRETLMERFRTENAIYRRPTPPADPDRINLI